MNKFAFDLIDAINRAGLRSESWGVVENVPDTVEYFGSKERMCLPGRWAYIYAEEDSLHYLQLGKIEPTMILHEAGREVEDQIRLYNLE
jgi:hypothetical protein